MAEPRRDFAVVTVPDFSGAAAARFEAQALVFLACWIEYGGADAPPLHLACIGTPPPTVAALAERAGARVSTHAPLLLGGAPFFNKLRGLEVDVDAGGVLLVDCDVLVLKPLAWLAQYAGELAAAPSDLDRLTTAQWQRIGAGLGLDIPHRFHAQDVRLRLGRGADQMPCYYNSGVLLVPRGAGLRHAWEQAWHDLRLHFDPDEPDVRSVLRCDQAALAVALHRLEQQGWPARVLAPHQHARRGNVLRREVPIREAALFHLTGLLQGRARPRPGADLRVLLRRQRSDWRALLRRLWWTSDRGRAWPITAVTHLAPAWRDAAHLFGRVDAAVRRHVLAVLPDGRLGGAVPKP